jgi:hypothetical protein
MLFLSSRPFCRSALPRQFPQSRCTSRVATAVLRVLMLQALCGFTSRKATGAKPSGATAIGMDYTFQINEHSKLVLELGDLTNFEGDGIVNAGSSSSPSFYSHFVANTLYKHQTCACSERAHAGREWRRWRYGWHAPCMDLRGAPCAWEGNRHAICKYMKFMPCPYPAFIRALYLAFICFFPCSARLHGCHVMQYLALKQHHKVA